MADSELISVFRPGTALAGERWGTGGPVVVLLHEGIADRRSWREVAGALAAHATVLAYDRRGFGQTPPPDGPFSHLDDLLAVLDAVADGPAWLAGSSAGGGIAIDAALAAPDRLAGLVLLSPAVSGAPEPDLDPVTALFAERIDTAAEAGKLDEVNELEIALWLDGPAGPRGRVSGPARDLALEMNGIALRGDVPEAAGGSGLAAWDRLTEIQAPAVVACGDLDVPCLVSRSQEVAARLPRGSFRSLPDTAHLTALERPPLVTGLLRAAIGAG
ncbi:MAG: alpha/beta fold hydrolase [Streptosporangiaceae bacterium]